MPKVSVIVPIYNVEPYIERCVTSLMEQTLDDIEYIFVNDATPDNSIGVLKRVIDNYPERKLSVKILYHDENKGLPTARQTGLKEATGDYIIHCDSDDFVDTEIYKKLYDKAIRDDRDIIICDYFEGDKDTWSHKKGSSSNPTDIIIDSLLLSHVAAVWNKLVRKEIAKDPNILFPKYAMAEDLVLTIQNASIASRIGYLAEPLYYYARRDSSILGNRSPQALIAKQAQFIANFKIVEKQLQAFGIEDSYRNAIIHEKLFIKNFILPAITNKTHTKLWRRTFEEINSEVLTSNLFTLREKLNFVITYIGLYPLYRKMKYRNA